MSIDRYLAGLRARYDTLALRPPASAADETTRLQGQAAVARALIDWCQAGAGPGDCSAWQPGARPAVDLRLADNAPHDEARWLSLGEFARYAPLDASTQSR